MRMVILWHGNDGFPVKCSRPSLVHCVPGDRWGSGAGPVQCIPGSVIGKPFNRTHIWWGKEKKKIILLSTKDLASEQKKQKYNNYDAYIMLHNAYNDSWLHTVKLSCELLMEKFTQKHALKTEYSYPKKP